MEILSAIVSGVTKVGEYAVAPVRRQVGYVIQYKSNLQNLRTQVDDLKQRRQRTIDVNTMTQQVDELTGEVDTFLEDEGHAKTKCFHGFCPNPILYYQLSKKATKLMHKIKLHEKTEFPPQEICCVPSQDYLAFGSRISIVKEIMDELSNPNTNKIGVYGVGGVGKTTLAKEVYRKANEKKLFDGVVIVVDVKNYPERIQKENYIERIQKEIAEKLNIDIRECLTEKGRARHLWDKLKDKKILVILDDVWEKIELEDVGIPQTCNILFTSRNREVLYSKMGTQKDFSLAVLGEVESWGLFEKMAGAVVMDERIREKAIKISNKCGGLPILIVTVASALRNGTLDQWKDALRRLEKFDLKELAEKALLTLEWSCNQLDAEELKPLFLLCGIIARGDNRINLSDCFKYSMGLGLLKNVDTMEETQAAFNSLIKRIQNFCLLLEQPEDNKYTRMHELVRSVAIMIAQRDQRVLLREYEEEFKEWPNKDFFKNCTMICLYQSNIPKLPEGPWECRELKMLDFDNIDESLEIPSNFFEEMKELKVLDLTRFCIPSLPPSLGFLTNLQSLCLDQCVLEDISLVGQLRNLKILSLLKSKIKQLPKEIGQLARLRMLDLTGCSELVLISPNVIANLKNLEDLRMGRNSFRQWEAEGVRNASLLELKQLSKLTALDIHIPDANTLPCNLFSKLERFHLFIGEAWEWLDFDDSFNTLKLKLDRSSHLDRGLEMLLKRSEHLCLDVKEGFDNIFHLLNRSDGIQHLKRLEVQNNAEITHFNSNAFQNLQSLTLWNLPKLVGFSSESGTAIVTTRTDKQLKSDGKSKQIILENEIGSPVQLLKSGEILMHNLTTLIVHQCDGLRVLLSPSMARSLVQLKHLEIRSCQLMEEIVLTKESGEENTENIFCKLNHLQLQHLPKLTRFFSGNFIKFPSLEILHLEDCTELGTFISDPPMMNNNTTTCKDNSKSDLKDNLESTGQYFLFDEKVAFPSLERLIIYDLPKLMTIWHNQLAQSSFCRLKKLEVQRCHDLTKIFAASIMGRLNALDTLQIENCKSLQVLFELDGINAEKTDESSGTKLRIVECCQNLDLVKIISCERLKNIFPASVVKSLHNLRMLHVELCDGVEAIVGKKEGPQTIIPKFMFQKVTDVLFRNMPQLTSFYTGMHSTKWPLLKKIEMFGCHKVEIFASEFLRFQDKIASAPGSRQPFFLIEKGSLLNLETLYLGDAELEIWDGPLPEELSTAWPCKLKNYQLASKSSAAFLEKLRNLENLYVFYVPFKEIFVNEANSSSVGSLQLLHLKELQLYEMTELVHLGKDNSQPVIPNLEILEVEDCVRLRNVTSPAIAFQNLTTLKVIGCHGLEFLTTCSIAQSLMQLKHMEVKDCRGMIQILENSNQDSVSIEIAFLRLQHLELSGLPSLQCFCSGNCIVKLPSLDTLTVDNADITYVINHNAFQKLQSLTLMNLPKPVSFSTRMDKQLKIDGESREIMLKNEIATPVQLFKNGEIVMPNLTSLIVHQFNGLRFLLSSSMARSLVQLKHLEIRSCQIMEEIVSTKESGEENTENLFCKLTHLELQHLPKLTRFCSGNLIKFLSLEILHLEDCTELQTFISDPPMISDNITTCKDNSESDLKDNLESARQYFLFDEKVAFPRLERLIIYDLPKMITIWHNQLAQGSFCRLKKLDIQRCHDLINIFAASIMGRLNALDTLHIEDCKSLQVLFELDGINAEKIDESSGTQLRIVECCQNLDLVKIISCERLKNIFPASVVKSLHNLRMLHVELCNGVETIIGKEEGPQTTIPKFMFPKVISVEFKNLPQLMSFYPGMHSSKWPLLKELVMNECDKVGIVASEFLRFQEKLASTPGSKQPFFLIEKGSLLNLEALFLGDAELEIWDGPLPEELSATWPCKLKKFWCYSKSSAVFLEKLRNLEFLSMGYTPVKEIFVNEAYSSSVGSLQLLHLTFLQLFKMPDLVHLGKDNSQLVIPNLEILVVYHCVRLRNLTSPAIAFQNLTFLEVIGCHKLEFLTTCSIAQSLMQLKHMEVKDCRGLIQILENSNQDSGSIEIAFLRLQHLELSGLPSLQGFCSGNCIVKLPSLDTLTVTDCLIELELSPEKLLLSNSRLERIKLIEEEGKDHDKPEGSGKT